MYLLVGTVRRTHFVKHTTLDKYKRDKTLVTDPSFQLQLYGKEML